jgi:hypothetical protein
MRVVPSCADARRVWLGEGVSLWSSVTVWLRFSQIVQGEPRTLTGMHGRAPLELGRSA